MTVGAGSLPRQADGSAAVDLIRAEAAAGEMLTALGVDLSPPARTDTPRRMAHAYAEMLSPPEYDMTTFGNEDGYDELILVQDIPVRSLCEHHMLPFSGLAHIGYLPDHRILGLSKFARTVAYYASQPQTQERLTQEVADELDRELAPRGVGVVVTAEHACMSHRGAQARGTQTVSSALFGALRDNP